MSTLVRLAMRQCTVLSLRGHGKGTPATKSQAASPVVEEKIELGAEHDVPHSKLRDATVENEHAAPDVLREQLGKVAVVVLPQLADERRVDVLVLDLHRHGHQVCLCQCRLPLRCGRGGRVGMQTAGRLGCGPNG